MVPKLELLGSDFDGVDVPIKLTRDLNITGSPDLPGRPIMDLSPPVEDSRLHFLRVEFRGGCKVVFRQFIAVSGASSNSMLTSAPGLDLFLPRASGSSAGGASGSTDTGGPSTPAEPALVVLIDVAFTFWLCLPPEALLTTAAKYTRPANFPGSQSAKLTLGSSQAACDNTTQSARFPDEASLMTRCWAQRFDYVDVVVEATTYDSALGRDVSSGFTVQLLDSAGLCEEEMPRDCLSQYGAAGCLASLDAARASAGLAGDAAGVGSSPPSALPAAAPPSETPAPAPPGAGNGTDGALQGGAGNAHPAILAGSGKGGTKLGAVVGSVVGGAAVLVVALVAALLWRARRGQAKWRSPAKRPKMDSPVSSDDLERRPQQPSPFSPSEGRICLTLDTDFDSPGYSTHAGPDSSDPAEDLPCHAAMMVHDDASDAKGSKKTKPSRAPDASPPVTALTRTRPSLETRRLNEELALLPNTLGKGAFGRVVEGTFRGERVAVKLMPSELVDGSAFPMSFLQEVEILGRCAHPNVVRLLAVNLRPPRPCLVMELMETSLDKLIRSAAGSPSGLPLDEVLHIAAEVARGLEYLHPTITHRDLKPANVLLSGAEGPRPTVKLADFGLSRLRMTAVATEHPEAGTPAYMAPECFDVNNFVVTHHADMFSFGCLLWALLAGQEPWAGLDAVAIATQSVVHGRRLPLEVLPAGRCPPKVARLLAACWEADPLRRPAAADAVKVLVLVTEGFTGEVCE